MTSATLEVTVCACARGMLDRIDDDLPCRVVNAVIDNEGVAPRDNLAHALDCLRPACTREPTEHPQGFEDRGTDAHGGSGILGANVVTNRRQILSGSRREAQPHGSNRRNAASTSASLAKSPRLACASPSSTAGKWAESTASGWSSLPTSSSMVRAISSWVTCGSRRTASRALSRSFVMDKS